MIKSISTLLADKVRRPRPNLNLLNFRPNWPNQPTSSGLIQFNQDGNALGVCFCWSQPQQLLRIAIQFARELRREIFSPIGKKSPSSPNYCWVRVSAVNNKQ